jgi:hypothetical protein
MNANPMNTVIKKSVSHWSEFTAMLTIIDTTATVGQISSQFGRLRCSNNTGLHQPECDVTAAEYQRHDADRQHDPVAEVLAANTLLRGSTLHRYADR